jgi:chromosomal replication initiation ATPase DnaA
LDPDKIAVKVARLLGCNIKGFKNISRASGQQKEKRDLVVYLIWQTGLLTNEKTGAIFGLTYSSVSHIVRSVRLRIAKDRKFRTYIEELNSQFKV